MRRAWRIFYLAIACATGLVAAPDAQAAEYAQGIYVLGNRGPLAGVTPPPGKRARRVGEETEGFARSVSPLSSRNHAPSNSQ